MKLKGTGVPAPNLLYYVVLAMDHQRQIVNIIFLKIYLFFSYYLS